MTKSAIGKKMLILVVVLVLAAGSLAFITLSQKPPQKPPPEPEVRIGYTMTYSDTLGGTISPRPGHTFLILHLTIENRGYSNFTANPFRDMYVRVGEDNYDVSATAPLLLDDYFSARELRDGESAVGSVSFEVPQGTSSFTPQWRLSPTAVLRLTWSQI